MKLTRVRIQNFRSIHEATVDFDDYTAFVGPNGSGKSTVLTALRIFFRDTSGSPTDLLSLTKEDFHRKDTSQEIAVTLTFDDLEQEAQTEFAHYVRQGKLIVSAVAEWDENTRSAVVRQYGERLVMKEFGEFFRAEKTGSVTDLKEIYKNLRDLHGNLPAVSTKAGMIDALHAFEASNSSLCELDRSTDEFYGFSKGANKLQKYIQWVFIPAVKDASAEQLEGKKNALGILLERTVRSRLSFDAVLSELRAKTEDSYRKLLMDTASALDSLSGSLSARIKDWAHPEAVIKLQWHEEANKYVAISEPLAQVFAAEGDFGGDLSRFGHGFQRSFLFALLQELSASQADSATRLILACEEPEVHQHPPQAKHLALVLERLTTKNSQVLVCTHSPYFISGRGFEDVRLVRKDKRLQETLVGRVRLDELATRISGALGCDPPASSVLELKVEQTLQVNLNEMFFATVLILVEGIEDEAYLRSYLALLDKLEEFRACGCHIVAVGGKNKMIQPLAIAKLLEVPTFVIFDADTDECKNKEKTEQQRRDNLAILRLAGVPKVDPLSLANYVDGSVCMWATNMGDEIKAEIGADKWVELDAAIRKRRGIDSGSFGKNALFIGSMLTEGWGKGLRSKMLELLCHSVLSFASSPGRSNKALAETSGPESAEAV